MTIMSSLYDGHHVDQQFGIGAHGPAVWYEALPSHPTQNGTDQTESRQMTDLLVGIIACVMIRTLDHDS